ncbi:unnamed protein product [Cylicostephanus goldi]|uniref:Myosin tail domain-containing protein n=1 Tax=Cylicostephanus goldi TaxID=71465 RepID=A0A3P6S5F3_CYLGO|nr:unnamed protein product [Cylicostephanus goldi]
MCQCLLLTVDLSWICWNILCRSCALADPTPILEQAIVWKAQAEKTNIAVEEANHFRAQIALVQTELADLKNQDVTIRQLRDTIAKLEEDKAREVEQAISEVEKELRDEFSIRDHETTMRSDKLKAENAALEKKVSFFIRLFFSI